MAADPADIDAAAALLRVLANPGRLRIALRLLEGEQAVGALETGLGIKQPALSQQLAEMREAGLVTGRRSSKSVVYSLAGADERRLVAALAAGFGITVAQTLLDRAPPDRAAVPARNPHARPAAVFATVQAAE